MKDGRSPRCTHFCFQDRAYSLKVKTHGHLHSPCSTVANDTSHGLSPFLTAIQNCTSGCLKSRWKTSRSQIPVNYCGEHRGASSSSLYSAADVGEATDPHDLARTSPNVRKDGTAIIDEKLRIGNIKSLVQNHRAEIWESRDLILRLQTRKCLFLILGVLKKRRSRSIEI